MSLIARCPACATLFRVVPDQLKISDGWVRCGQCSEVFDANQTLQPASAPLVPAATPETGPVLDPGPITSPAPDPEPAADALIEQAPEPARETAPEPEPEPEPDLTPEPEPEPVLEPVLEVAGETPPPLPGASPGSEPAEPVFEAGPLPGDVPEDTPRDAPEVPPAADDGEGVPPVDRPEAQEAPPLQDLAFVRQARRRAFWRRRGVRVTLGVMAGVLSLSLAGQIVFHHRDRLASQVPALQPVLGAMCASLKCRLGPPRRIESIAIESSAFTRVRADAFRLSLTLSNQADIALAMPAMELTLTDLQDQPVLRRVLQPADLGPDTPSAIAARTEWSTTLTLAIEPAANPARIVGYRVLAFYP